MRYPTVLSIAGSDSCAGAGIQADMKTMSALGVYGCTAITAITAQNTTGVRSIQGIDPSILKDQIDMLFEDIEIDAVKSGMLFSKASVEVIADAISKYKPKFYVLDPVMISTSGSRLIDDDAIVAVKELLFPLSSLLTPNIKEAEVLSGISIKTADDMGAAAEKILQAGSKAVLIKGGHLEGTEAVDMLFEAGKDGIGVKTPFIETNNTHGTGCTLSSAIASYLAMGEDLRGAFMSAKDYIIHALYGGKKMEIGHGHGPVDHFYMLPHASFTKQ